MLLAWAWLGAKPAQAQDLFEIEVFPFETATTGDTLVDLHTNGMTASRLTEPAVPDHPFHASVEVTHGWTPHFETGVFIETAPVVPAHGTRFAGGHIRPKFRLLETARVPMQIGLVAEYGFNRGVFDQNRQTLELVPILQMRYRRATIVANPAWAMTIDGPDATSLPKVSASASVDWETGRRFTPGLEYYWKTEPLKHFDAKVDRHHFVVPTLDISLSDDWHLDLGAGHCVTGNSERWIVKSIVGYRFH